MADESCAEWGDEPYPARGGRRLTGPFRPLAGDRPGRFAPEPGLWTRDLSGKLQPLADAPGEYVKVRS